MEASPQSPGEVRWGLTLPFTGVPLHDHRPLVERAETAGFTDLWSGETANGYDGFTPLVLAAAWTERMRLATGIVNPFTRGPGVLAQSAAALQDASNGRFVLGLGASSDVIVERFNGLRFEKPLSAVREAVERLRPVLGVPAERGFGGLRLESPVTVPVPIVLAALRERMLRLAGEVADGAFTNFLPLAGAERVVAEVRRGEQAAGRAAGSVEVACRFFCIPQPREQGIGLARMMFAAYGSVPVYHAFFRWLGYAEQVDPMAEAWQSGDRQRALELVPDDLIAEIFVFGDPAEQRARLDEYASRGITTLILTPIAGPDDLPGLIDTLAPS